MMLPVRPPLCLSCARLRDTEDLKMVCGAFPDGIPDPIADGFAGHFTSWEGEATYKGEMTPARWRVSGPGPHSDEVEGPIIKGDFEGHPFRGNQWTDGGPSSPPDEETEARLSSEEEGMGMARMKDVEESHDQATMQQKMKDVYFAQNIRRLAAGERIDGNRKVSEAEKVEAIKRMSEKLSSLRGANVVGEYPGMISFEARMTAFETMSRVDAAMAALPAATREMILKDGMTVTVRPFDPATDKFEANGSTFTRGGSAGFNFENGHASVTLVVFSEKDGSMVPPRESVIEHELGHVSVDHTYMIQRDRTSNDEAGKEADNLQTAREYMKDMVGNYKRAADELERLDTSAMSPEKIANLNATVRRYRDEAESLRTQEQGLREVERTLYDRSRKLNSWKEENRKLLDDLTAAVNEEGGFTDYAETWNQDPAYGKGGHVTDPVHRGVHESVAELESEFIKLQRSEVLYTDQKRTTIHEFARTISEDGARGGGRDKAFPKLAKAWVAWRKSMDRKPDLKAPKYRLPKEMKAKLEAHKNAFIGADSYQGWRRAEERMAEHLKQDLDSFKNDY